MHHNTRANRHTHTHTHTQHIYNTYSNMLSSTTDQKEIEKNPLPVHMSAQVIILLALVLVLVLFPTSHCWGLVFWNRTPTALTPLLHSHLLQSHLLHSHLYCTSHHCKKVSTQVDTFLFWIDGAKVLPLLPPPSPSSSPTSDAQILTPLCASSVGGLHTTV